MSGMTPEFSRRFTLAEIGSMPRSVSITADASECAAMAKRFGLLSVASLSMNGELVARAAGIDASGTIKAQVTQSCVATGEPVSAILDEPFHILFTALEVANEADEIELSPDACDEMEHDGNAVDLGEAAAQTLALVLDPFPRAANAWEILAKAGVAKEGEESVGPFAALKALKNQSP
jgi:uncharacterized metal-binding protein YceD (DUF177 family)